MNVNDTAQRQIARLIDRAANAPVRALAAPSGGWIAAMRKALGMSGTQLGRRMGLSRKRISQVEKAEPDGGVTLRSMRELADAMNGRFVYAIVPKAGSVNDVIEAQARKKAEALVSQAGTHMALEKQALSKAQREEEVARIAADLLARHPRDLWADE